MWKRRKKERRGASLAAFVCCAIRSGDISLTILVAANLKLCMDVFSISKRIHQRLSLNSQPKRRCLTAILQTRRCARRLSNPTKRGLGRESARRNHHLNSTVFNHRTKTSRLKCPRRRLSSIRRSLKPRRWRHKALALSELRTPGFEVCRELSLLWALLPVVQSRSANRGNAWSGMGGENRLGDRAFVVSLKSNRCRDVSVWNHVPDRDARHRLGHTTASSDECGDSLTLS